MYLIANPPMEIGPLNTVQRTKESSVLFALCKTDLYFNEARELGFYIGDSL